MNPLSKITLALALTGVASGSLAAPPTPRIMVTGARIRVPPPGAPTAAGYATITNTSDRPDRLLGGSTPAAARLEIHEMSMAGGVMRMRPVVAGLPIGPRQSIALTEGGYHFMLVSPRRPLKSGDRVPATLRFRTVGAVPVTFKVGA